MTTTATGQQSFSFFLTTSRQGLHNGYVSMGRDLIQYLTRWVAVWAACSSLAAAWRSLGVEWMHRFDATVLAARVAWKNVRCESMLLNWFEQTNRKEAA